MYEDQVLLAKIYLSTPIWISTKVWSSYRLHDDSCMSAVGAEGSYKKYRGMFLAWLASYLKGKSVDLRVRRSLRRAIFKHQHPRTYQLWTRFRRRIGVCGS
jgi:hypothetical protein